jgi:hypothetical protein
MAVKATHLAESSAATNDASERERKADAEIKAQFNILMKSEGALTVVGGIMARAYVDGVYLGTAREVAWRIYRMRGVTGKSDAAQISKQPPRSMACSISFPRRGGISSSSRREQQANSGCGPMSSPGTTASFARQTASGCVRITVFPIARVPTSSVFQISSSIRERASPGSMTPKPSG